MTDIYLLVNEEEQKWINLRNCRKGCWEEWLKKGSEITQFEIFISLDAFQYRSGSGGLGHHSSGWLISCCPAHHCERSTCQTSVSALWEIHVSDLSVSSQAWILCGSWMYLMLPAWLATRSWLTTIIIFITIGSLALSSQLLLVLAWVKVHQPSPRLLTQEIDGNKCWFLLSSGEQPRDNRWIIGHYEIIFPPPAEYFSLSPEGCCYNCLGYTSSRPAKLSWVLCWSLSCNISSPSSLWCRQQPAKFNDPSPYQMVKCFMLVLRFQVEL